MNEMIEKLKRNRIPFGLLGPEEQEYLMKVGLENCVRYDSDNKWPQAMVKGDRRFHPLLVYAIKSEYQIDLEYEDLEIVMCEGGFLGVKKKLDNNVVLPHEQTYLFCLSGLPNFKEFWFRDSIAILPSGLPERWPDSIPRVSFTDDGKVATHIDEGKKVYARLRSK